MVRLGIVDDKLINRRTLKENLSGDSSIQIVLEAENGEDFLRKMEALNADHQADIILMDIDMPIMNGIEAIAVGTIRFPRTKFLVLTVFDDDEKIFEAIQAGAAGYLLKEDNAIQLSDAISQAMEFNATPMSPSIARKTLEWVKKIPKPKKEDTLPENEILSAREIEILQLMAEGLDYKQIADRLILSPHTIRTHISKIYEKLHVNSKALAIQMAYKYNWIKK